VTRGPTKSISEAADAAEFEAQLLRLYRGPVVGGGDLPAALGFRSNIAFQRAARRGAIPLPLFRMEGRRGLFVLVKDLAQYLLQRRALGDQVRRVDPVTGRSERREQQD
jgi:hypothetical protein